MTGNPQADVECNRKEWFLSNEGKKERVALIDSLSFLHRSL
jgi:hypothetical protein